jgi:predicted esterase
VVDRNDDRFDIKSLSPSGPLQEDEQGMLASVKTISDLIAAEVDAGIPSQRIVVGGFSQGESTKKEQGS